MTPSAPPENDLRIISGCTIPEHITRIIRIFGGYCIREVPARSAAAYEHQLQQKAIIFGSKLIVYPLVRMRLPCRAVLRAGLRAAKPGKKLQSFGYTASAASIWLSSCLKVNPATDIPRLGQVPWQSPQPLQWARLTDTSLCTSPFLSLFSIRLIAW